MDKKTIKTILSKTIIILLAITVFIIVCKESKRVLYNKTDGLKMMNSFYAQEPDTIDVAFIGSSRVFCDINPAVLWKEYGVSSFDLASGAQPIALSALMARELFKTQHPSVLALEVSQVNNDGNYDLLQLEPLIGGIKTSKERIRLAYEKSPDDMNKDVTLSFPMYHNHYEEASKEDLLWWKYYEYRASGKKGYKGYIDYWHQVPFDGYEGPSIDNEEVTDGFIEALDCIKDICDKNNCELLLFYSPDIYCHDYTKLHKYADENNVRYINANLLKEKIGLDTKSDYIDDGHLNIYGAEKWTKYLYGEICSTHTFVDHRGDAKYSSWDDNAYFLEATEKSNKFKDTTGLLDYMNMFPSPDYIVILSMVGDYSSIVAGQKDLLAQHFFIDDYVYSEGGTAVFDGEQCLYYSDKDDQLDYTLEVNGRLIEIRGRKNSPEIYVDGVESSVVYNGGRLKNGIQIVVFDKLKNKVIDAIDYNTDRDFAWEKTTE